MSKHFRIFENAAEYNSVKDSLATPNVCMMRDTRELAFNKYYDPYAGHDYVEIAGIKWATMNIGANSITDYGAYFQWGDTQGYTASQIGNGSGKKRFNWPNYKYCNGTSSPGAAGMTKYNSTDGKTVLDASDDAAQANWGGAWRMPTTAEYAALGAAVNVVWTTNYQGSGVAGLVCTDKTDSSKELFFPATGACYDVNVLSGSFCGYWSGSLDSSNVTNGKCTLLYSFGLLWQDVFTRSNGLTVRGVVG